MCPVPGAGVQPGGGSMVVSRRGTSVHARNNVVIIGRFAGAHVASKLRELPCEPGVVYANAWARTPQLGHGGTHSPR
eukprot:575096-Prymnesium_polylepis.1